MKILFVCTGNLCRSVMSEQLMRKLARDAGLECETRSCGLAAASGAEVPAEVFAELKKRGVPLFKHRPRPVGRDLLEWCDVALVMTKDHRQRLGERFPEFFHKVHLLRRHAGLDDEDVADPMGGPAEVYAACCGSIAQALEALNKRHEHA